MAVSHTRDVPQQKFDAACGSDHRSLSKDRFIRGFPELGALPKAVAAHVFNVFDMDNNGVVDFREFCITLARACLGPGYDRLRFLFHLFDVKGEGQLSHVDLRPLLAFCWRQAIYQAGSTSDSKTEFDAPVACDSSSTPATPCDAWVDEQVRGTACLA